MTVGNETTMRAWVLDRPAPVETSPLRYVHKPVPAAGPGELLVRVLACPANDIQGALARQFLVIP